MPTLTLPLFKFVYNAHDALQGVKKVKSRQLMYWMIAILALLLCLAYPIGQSETAKSDPLIISSLMKVEPKYISYYDNRFHALLSGQLKIDIKTEHIQNKLTEYDLIHIKDLEIDHNSKISLGWQIEDKWFQTPLNHNKQSFTPIDFNTDDAKKIQNLHLLLTSNHELNTNPSLPKTVSFNAIYFEQKQNLNSTDLSFSQWFGFNPIEVNSINGYSNLPALYLQELIWRLMSWLAICSIAYFLIQINATHLIACIALAWVVTATPFSVNFIRQHQQLNTAFSGDKQFINSLDKNIHQLAQSVKESINSNDRIDIETDQFIILGSNQFEYLRLFYHLTELNVAVHMKVPKTATKSPIYILTHDYFKQCNQQDDGLILGNRLKVMSIHPEFCLAKPL